MGRKKLSFASRPKPASSAPSSSTDPLPSDASQATIPEEYERALLSLRAGDQTRALKLVEDSLSRHPHSAVLHGIRSVAHHKAAFLIRDYDAKLKHLRNAVASADRALALAPNSISFSLFRATALYELAENSAVTSASDYEVVIRECERGLLIDDPTDPVEGRLGKTEAEEPVPAERVEAAIEDLLELVEKSNKGIAILGGWNRKDWFKRLVKDNSLTVLKNEIEALERIKKEITEPMPLNFEMPPSRDDQFKEKSKYQNLKKLLLNDDTIGRVRTYWNNTMDVEKRKELLRIGIEELKAYLDKNKMAMVKEVLIEATYFAKEAKKWKFWECCYCGERFSAGESNLNHICNAHIGTLSENLLSLAPELAPELAAKMLEADVWKPVDSISAAKIMGNLSSTADKGSEVFNFSQLPYCDDGKRAGIIERIRAGLQLFMKINSLASSHLTLLLTKTMEMLQNRIPISILMDLGLHQTLHSICLLEVPELERVLDCLEDLASACALRCLCESYVNDGVLGDQGLRISERIVFSGDFSCLILDERLLRGEVDVPDDGTAVASTTADDCSKDEVELPADSDAFVYWLWVGGPTIGEQLKAWTSLREPTRSRGMEFFKILKMEFQRVQRMCKRKFEILRYENALLNVERMCLEENEKRELIPDYDAQSYESLLLKRRKELEVEGDAATDNTSIEMDIIRSILEEAQADTDINKAIPKQREHLSRELCKLDAIMLATKAAIGLTRKKLGRVSVYDYRVIMVPLLKSVVQERLLDLVDKDASEKSNAAAEALLEELSLDTKSNTDKGCVNEKKGMGKSNDKKKEKHHGKAKDSEGTGRREEQHPLNQENVEQCGFTAVHGGDYTNPETGVPVSTDELEQREKELELEAEAEEMERKLDEALEFQRKIENDAKQKRLAEKAQIMGGTRAENAAEDVHVISSEPGEVVGPSEQEPEEELKREQQREEELEREADEMERKLDEALEFQRKIENEAKQKRLAEKAQIMGRTRAENVAEDVPVISSEPGEVVGPIEQEPEEELKREQQREEELEREAEAEEMERKLDEALEFQRKIENEAKQKRLAEKAQIMGGTRAENVAEDVPVISSEPGEVVGPSEQEREEELKREQQLDEELEREAEAEEMERKLDEALEFQRKIENEAKQKRLAEKAQIMGGTRAQNVAEDVPVISSGPREVVGPSEQQREKELEREAEAEAEEMERKLDEALEFQRKIENEAKQKRLAEKAQIMGGTSAENVAEDVTVIFSERGEVAGPSEQEREEELKREDEQVQGKLDETLESQRQIENEAEQKELAEQDKNSGGTSEDNVVEGAPVVSAELNEDVDSCEKQQQLRPSGLVPLPFSSIRFGSIDWTDVSEAQHSEAREAE